MTAWMNHVGVAVNGREANVQCNVSVEGDNRRLNILEMELREIDWEKNGAPLIVTLVLPLVIGVILLLKCILNHCCVRRTTTKSTLHRQLPDLPQVPNLQALHPPRRSSSVLSHDGNSELYATVGEVPNIPNPNIPQSSGPDGRSYYNGKSVASHTSSSRGTTPGTSGTSKNNVGSSKSEPTPSSDSETYTLNHPYAKLKRSVGEHPYARVRTASVGGDEETDTDNYDTPHPYAQTGRNLNRNSQPPGNGQANARGEGDSASAHQQNILSSTSANVGDVNRQPGNPIPPRRAGRQWRRSSNPQAQDNQPQHFSGDSQDSRGYTSISVREPLSNIIANRNEVPHTRSYDSHYATVSDDSEEMYAAIEDPEGNYMRISGEDGEPGGRHWHGAPGIASPIPERREANSPLPPPPPVPPLASPPEMSPTGPLTTDQSQQGNQTSVPNPAPPLYAQVTKKSKKGKAPVTPTSSINASSSQNNNSVSNFTNEVTSINPSSPLPSSSQNPVSATSSTSTNKSRHAIPESSIPILSPIEPSVSEPRRWSKADISYSEFEVVREPMYSTSIAASLGGSARGRRKSPDSSMYQITDKKPINAISSEKMSSKKHKVPDVLDEDNYNVIPEPVPVARSSREGSSKNRKVSSNSNNYQEILDTYQSTNAYQEIDRKEPSDYYQEIGARLASEQNGGEGSSNLYQEIEKKQVVHTTTTTEIEDDEDLNDEFYETVKPASVSSKPKYLTSPSHSQGSVTSLDRKHGYEKLKKKGSGPPTVVIIASDDDDDDEEEDENKNEDSMYERVKYPPYERLKESRDDLHELPPDDDNFDRNFYEDIGYSRVKPKSKKPSATVLSTTESNKDLPRSDDALDNQNPKDASTSFSNSSNNNPYGLEVDSAEVSNLDQLYARVDKTKKKKHAKIIEASCSTTTSTTSTLVNTEISVTRMVESGETKSDVTGDTPKACIVLRSDRDDNSIEYI
ncbi:unnamed protein product [Allacma fusca]|uniref:Uncharacterized protein n=1 Tax=Allacma fusca TaxID=39272 RepID=A0A8J2PJ50_9HEXA|nr:unnamed protein product [Allacma fusca]